MTRILASRTDRRQWIKASLFGSALMLLLTATTLLLKFLLACLGDERGSQAASVTAIVTATAFVIGHVLLVSLLALDALDSNMERASLPHSQGPPSS